MRIELTGMTPSGEAIGHGDGKVVFVRDGLPGETVDVDITHRRRSYARGRVSQVIEPAPDRVEPLCEHFGVCGGCEWQHAAYPAQLAYKTAIVREQLSRLGGICDPLVRPCVASPQTYGYRNHIQLVLSERGRPGYRRAGSHAIVEIERCPIVDSSLSALLPAFVLGASQPVRGLKEIHLRAGVNTGERMVVFEMEQRTAQNAPAWVSRLALPGDTSIAIGDGVRTLILAGRNALRERVGESSYRYSPRAFFQVNTPVAGSLVDEVLGALDLSGGENVLDLYCGAGLFTVPIARLSGFTLGIESNPVAARDAQANLVDAPRAAVLCADVADGLLDETVRARRWHRVVLDPPRAGVDRTVLMRVADLGAPRLVYVSCDPATLARDARLLGERGYRFARAQPLDMFPQTHHVETAAVFERQRLQAT